MAAEVKGWKASYYQNSQKKWLYGELLLCPRYIRFVEDEEKSDKVDFKLFYDEFLEMKKETSTLFFAAITVRVKDDKYWFSSLTSRGTVFNNIEHFWKERIFASGLADDAGNVDAATSGGKALLNILYDSQSTLSSTARTIHQQGHQIDSACRTMNRIHRNLDVAETITHSLDSWLNSWNVETPTIHIEVPDNVELIQKTEFPVLYAMAISMKQEPGSLIISNQCIDVLNAERTMAVSFSHNQVSEVSVVTPWEMVISKYTIGKPDETVCVTSARMAYILRILEVAVGTKIQYSEPPAPSSLHNMMDKTSVDKDDNESLSFERTPSRPSEISSNMEPSSKRVTEAEAAEMSQLLSDMRAVALGIQTEQDRQTTQLEYLSDSVDKANERVKKDTRRVKKLT